MIVCSLVLILGIGTVTLSYVNFYEKLENNLIHSTESNLTFLADNINQELEMVPAEYGHYQLCQALSLCAVLCAVYDSGKGTPG